MRLHAVAALDLAVVTKERGFSALPAAEEGAYSGAFYDDTP
jgi:hypothetical protein